ncbi:lamin tail domain-containing protein [Halobacterium bonnevillei]|uniref:MBL fold metallo-hydrolase n=1 Tax=Halobacterium bonnevillei TaxID=2692200 RepID=A0A6B0SNY6_9EURY|nr:lamin tail domain-containing protein [Halobacterium bonnevillei]MXR21233.1 MBL fold metallo-hydrolase [Halobacterium bonnevillei]
MDRRRVFGVLAVVVLVTIGGCSGAITDGATTPGTTDSSPGTPGPTTEATTTTSTVSPNGTLSVHFLNVGQGGSTLVVGPTNETMLVDTGDWSDDGEDVIAYLESQDVERIDYLVSTHADADHIGGHAAVIDYVETEGDGVGAVYDPGIASSSQTYQNYLDAVERHDVALYEARAGDRIPFEGVGARVLAPPADYIANGDRNENSLVLHLEFGASSFLLQGDGETASERYLVDEYGAELAATALSASHHGSESSSGSEFLDAADPRVAVVSSAYDSQYGHPDESVLERFAARSIPTYWTATHGNVRMTSNGSALTVATQRNAPTDPLALRDGAPIEPGTDDEVQVRTVVHVDGGTTDPATTTEPATTEPATTGGTTAQGAALSVVEVHADAAGNDNENLDDEYVVFENAGDRSLDLGGWTVADEAGHTYTFPAGFSLGAGARVTLYTGAGADTATSLYWGAGSAVWNNGGDTVVVRTEDGSEVLREAYE